MRLYIAGINGMVGSSLSATALNRGYEVLGKSSHELDFTKREDTFAELERMKPDALIIAAAKVGGIGANSSTPVDFLSINLQIQTNLMDAAHAAGIKKVLFLGSSCIYPKYSRQPISESEILTGELEPTNEAYALSKIAGLKLISAYRQQFGHSWISVMPTNLYGPGDNFDLDTAHVLPALIHRFHNAKVKDTKSVQIWGDGTPLREFLHVQDLAIATLLLLEKFSSPLPINIGSGIEISINDLAILIAEKVGFHGMIVYDKSKPNGTPRKFLDSSQVQKLGWRPKISLDNGIASTYEWFLANRVRV
jgi:GDP-L-fucose synthase